MTSPTPAPDPVTASREAFGWDDESGAAPPATPTARPASLRLGLFLIVAAWFALIGFGATLHWLFTAATAAAGQAAMP